MIWLVRITLIAAAAVAACLGAGDYRLPSPYGWRCLAGSCVRQDREALSPPPALLHFSTCKLTCGTHATLWPKPSKYTKLSKQTTLFLASNLKLSTVRSPYESVEALTRQAWDIFLASLQLMDPTNSGDPCNTAAGDTSTADKTSNNAFHSPLVTQHEVLVDITVSRPDTQLTFQTPELYTLGITTTRPSLPSLQRHYNDSRQARKVGVTRVSIIGTTFFGARHALETLSQLMEYNEETNSYEIVSTAAVVDEPVYPYRGLLLDTARNYFSVASIKRTLDGMAANKMNTFHWHISDSQSFPLVLRSLPKMAYYGAFSARKTYTPDDVRDLVSYARVRGIRIVPEVDAPAHVGNGWQWGEKEGLGELLACFNKRPWTRYCVEPPCGQLNLANPHIYTVLGHLYREYLSLFGPLELFHYGGDEINLNCWNSTKAITGMMVKEGHGLSSSAYYSQWATFQNKSFDLLTHANDGVSNITGIIWSSKLTQNAHVEQFLDKNKYIIQTWAPSNSNDIGDLLKRGYRIILSNSDAWYLDCGFSSWVSDGLNWCAPYKSWQKVYSNRPSVIARTTTGEERFGSQVLGGEVAAWSEQMDSVSLDYKVWPRAAAFAERVWSDPIDGWRAAEGRLVHHRQRLVARGIRAARIKPEWCHQHDAICTDLG